MTHHSAINRSPAEEPHVLSHFHTTLVDLKLRRHLMLVRLSQVTLTCLYDHNESWDIFFRPIIGLLVCPAAVREAIFVNILSMICIDDCFHRGWRWCFFHDLAHSHQVNSATSVAQYVKLALATKFCNDRQRMLAAFLNLNPLSLSINDVRLPQAYLGAAAWPTDPQLEQNQLPHTQWRSIDGPPQMDATMLSCLWPLHSMNSCIVLNSQDTMHEWQSLCNVERVAYLESM